MKRGVFFNGFGRRAIPPHPMDTGRLEQGVRKRRHRQESAGIGRHRRAKACENHRKSKPSMLKFIKNEAKANLKSIKIRSGMLWAGLWGASRLQERSPGGALRCVFQDFGGKVRFGAILAQLFWRRRGGGGKLPCWLEAGLRI